MKTINELGYESRPPGCDSKAGPLGDKIQVNLQGTSQNHLLARFPSRRIQQQNCRNPCSSFQSSVGSCPRRWNRDTDEKGHSSPRECLGTWSATGNYYIILRAINILNLQSILLKGYLEKRDFFKILHWTAKGVMFTPQSVQEKYIRTSERWSEQFLIYEY